MRRPRLMFAIIVIAALAGAAVAAALMARAGAPLWLTAGVGVLIVLEGLFWAAALALGLSLADRGALLRRIMKRLFGRDEDQPD